MSSPFLGDILLRKTSTSMSSTRARSNGFISNLPDCKFAATNPKIRQFFCNEAPKKSGFYRWCCVLRVWLKLLRLIWFSTYCAALQLVFWLVFFDFWQIIRTSIPRKRRKFRRGMTRNMSTKVKEETFVHTLFFSKLGSFHGKLLEYGGGYWCNE